MGPDSDEDRWHMVSDVTYIVCDIDMFIYTRAPLWIPWLTPCSFTSRGSYESSDLWADATRLAAMRPLCVSMDDVSVRFLYNGDVSSSQLGFALNGAVVGLAEEAAAAGERVGRDASQLHRPPPLCLGIGLVRAVDMPKRLLFVLSPLSLGEMQRVNTLVVSL